ncbi:MAG: tetratricopeptide repeat protein [Sphingobacteriales bacterium]|nr:MAG: tetratricopeptide repeat protein [Sphingobacteriales bacterium]
MRSPLSVLLLVLLSSVMSAKVSDSLLAAGAGKYHKGNYAKSFEIFDAAAGMARQQKDSATLIFAYRNLGNICSQTGRQVEALDFYQKSVSLSDAAGNLRESANTIRNIGALYGEMGDYKKALANYNIAETISITYKDTASIADCANNKGVIYEQYLQQYPAAILEYTKALELYKKMNNEERVSIAYNNLGIVYKATGNYEKAICARSGLRNRLRSYDTS